jgi:MFS superfamily sulfate permease-like transporter
VYGCAVQRFLPGFVIHGFTVGVAITIAGGQIASACGLRGLTVYPDFRDSLYEALSHLDGAQSQYVP